jgi:DnaJ-class molecular chaperone
VAQVLLDTPPESLPLPYRTLGLDSILVSRATVKQAYRQASLRNHPDRNRGEEAHVIMQGINQAKHCLDDQRERDRVYHDFLSTRL